MAASVAGRANWRRQNLDSATLLHTGQKVIILISLLLFIRIQLEFVTGGVELLRGHCTDIPADQGSYWVICAICSF